ncbi:hypothetical protein LM1000505_40042 [Listeria monocytogenes]|nr:hypothetical protein LM1000505_40042 [Listeria monocytogenes]
MDKGVRQIKIVAKHITILKKIPSFNFMFPSPFCEYTNNITMF